MPAKRQRSYFKLGRRGRRGRIAFDARWHIHRNPLEAPTGSLHRSEQNETDQHVLQHDIVTASGTDDEGHCPPVDRNNIPNPTDTENVLSNSSARPQIVTNDGRLQSQLIENNAPTVPPNTNVGITRPRHQKSLQTATHGDEDVPIDVMELMDSICDGTVPSAVTADVDDELQLQQVGENENGIQPQQDENSELDQCFADEQIHESNRHHSCETGDNTVGCSEDDISLNSAEFMRRFGKISSWQNMLSFIVVSGSVRFSVEQFEMFRTCVNLLLEKGFPGVRKLPAYSTVDRRVKPILSSWRLVRSETCTALYDVSKAGAKRGDFQTAQMGKFMIIMPSSWSIMDVACIQSWEQLKQAAESAKTNEPLSAFRNIESTPMLRRRDVVLKPLSIFLEEIGDAELAGSLRRRHDYVFTIRMRGRLPFPDYILSLLQHAVDDNSDVTSLKLIPVKTCLVKPANSWNDMSKASRREIELGMLSFLSVERPGLWFAGDLCTILKAESDVRYVMVLVHHQARPGHFTRRLELVCIPYSLPQSAQDMFCQLHWSQVRKAAVQGVSLETRGLVGERGMRYGESPMIPSYGRLRNGMPYFVDHLLLYSDGFTQYNFKTGSSGGVYCVSLNYPPHL